VNRRERRRQAKLRGKRRPRGGPADGRFQAAQAHQAAGRLDAAETLLRDILAGHPADTDAADAHGLLGVVLALGGRNADAVASFERAIVLAPAVAAYHNNLGNVLSSLGRGEEAVAAYGRALALRPDDAQTLNNLGTVLKAAGRLADARDAYERALVLNPDYAEAHSNYGNALLESGRIEEAAASHRRALAINPGYAVAHNNLGSALKRTGEYAAAAACFESALKLMPAYADALSNLGEVRRESGEAGAAIDYYRRALDAEPARPAIHSNLLYAQNFVAGLDRGAHYAEHRRWAELHAPPATLTHANDANPERRLRIGYVSPDFRRHSVSYFIEPVLAAHDPDAVEVFCYATSNLRDEVSDRLRGLADGWRDIDALGDGAAAQRIGADGIDILVDLSGHTMNGRLGLFARKPAPVQVAYLGYPNTTGLEAMDYRLTDARTDPEGDAEAFHTETLVRLPGGFLCYRPPDDAPPVATPGDRPVTFVSCNNLAKVTPRVVAAWADLLSRLPSSRLLLKAKALGDGAIRRRMAESFARLGVAPDRIDMRGWVDAGSHLGVYGGADIGLDTFPYNGTTTTCEALWMGVPVVTLAGDRHAGRVGASLMARAGLGDLVAATPAAYIETALGLAGDREALGRIRRRLRAMMADGGLTDAGAFTASLETAYRKMWRDWCKGRRMA
jgi:predicted O-linked N-acetylglucosamine transferase (SPINDLY family)